MAQVLVRNVDDAVIEKLKAKAAANDRSLNDVLREIIEASVKVEKEQFDKRLAEVRKQMKNATLDPVALIREDRDR